jgi:cold shock CspA family protein
MERGFGFIKIEEREGDLFFHRNDLEGMEFNSLREGQEVEFEMSQGRDNRPAAVKVRLIETPAEDAGTDKAKPAETPAEDAGSDSGDAGGNGEG